MVKPHGNLNYQRLLSEQAIETKKEPHGDGVASCASLTMGLGHLDGVWRGLSKMVSLRSSFPCF